jgi:Carboxypeptidase regulatory-like domain
MNIFEQARIPGRPGIHALQWTVMVSFMLGCLFGPAMAWGQDASIEGVVKDQSGAVVPGAEVSVTNLDTGVVRNVISNDAGLYAAPLLKEGRYRVTCRMSGFSSQQTEIRVQGAQVARVNFQLQLGEMSDVVQVSAEAELVQSKAQDVGQVIDEKRIRELPLNGRNYLELAQLSAGGSAFQPGRPRSSDGWGRRVSQRRPTRCSEQPSARRFRHHLQDQPRATRLPGSGGGTQRRSSLGIQGAHQQHVGRVWIPAGRQRRCVEQVGHQQLPRLDLRVPPQQRRVGEQLFFQP